MLLHVLSNFFKVADIYRYVDNIKSVKQGCLYFCEKKPTYFAVYNEKYAGMQISLYYEEVYITVIICHLKIQTTHLSSNLVENQARPSLSGLMLNGLAFAQF